KIGFKGFTWSADTAGNIYYARRRLNEDFLAALHSEFLKNGDRILRRAGEENPATFLKVLAQLVPRELQVENTDSIMSKLSDEQLAGMIEALEVQIQEALAAANGENAKVINAQAEPAAIAPAPGAPYRKAHPRSSPRELEYARVYARKRRAALKAQKAAAPEPPNGTTSESNVGSALGGPKRPGLTAVGGRIEPAMMALHCAENERSLPSSVEEPLK